MKSVVPYRRCFAGGTWEMVRRASRTFGGLPPGNCQLIRNPERHCPLRSSHYLQRLVGTQSGCPGLVVYGISQVRRRDLDNDVLVVFDQRHPPVFVSVWATNSFEFDIDLEVWTITTDVGALQSSG